MLPRNTCCMLHCVLQLLIDGLSLSFSRDGISLKLKKSKKEKKKTKRLTSKINFHFFDGIFQETEEFHKIYLDFSSFANKPIKDWQILEFSFFKK